jgi:ArsR family transcriptional regulator
MELLIFFKALSDETRLRLFHLLCHHELNVNEIVDILDMGQSRISRHLKILTDSNLVTYRKDGMWSFYSAISEGNGSRFTQSITPFFEDNSHFSSDLIRARNVVEERSMETVRFFDSIAEDWEKLKGEIIGDFDLSGLILSFVDSTDVIVDLGCGNGDLLLPLGEKGNVVIGVDKSPGMLDKARKRFSGNQNNIELRIGELEHLPLRDKEANLAIINMVLHHVASPITVLKEIYRILNQGAQFLILDLMNHQQELLRTRYGDRWLGFSLEQIGDLLIQSGFQLKKKEVFSLKKGLSGFIVMAQKK